jgi:hypothetical protein
MLSSIRIVISKTLFCHGILLSVMLSCAVEVVYSQALEHAGGAGGVKVSGGITSQAVVYSANGISGKRDPFNHFYSGNLNVDVYGWNIPFAFSYSNQHAKFHQPFNQYGISPSYKSLTVHAGYRSMSFSDYTVGGHLFLGGGVDFVVTPSVSIAGFYGRLQKRTRTDTTARDVLPAFERMGGGVKVSAGGEKTKMDVILFSAKDDINSLPGDQKSVDPHENFVIGGSLKVQVAANLQVFLEYGGSALTKDLRAEKVSARGANMLLSKFFQTRTSSSFYQAKKVSVQYAVGQSSAALLFERIDPRYETLGSYYFNSDIETYSFTGSTSFFQTKLTLSCQVGTQRNNLEKTGINSMHRLSGSATVNYRPSQALQLSGSFSNFQTVLNFNNRRLDDVDPINPSLTTDTLNYRQVAQNGVCNFQWNAVDNKRRRNTLQLNLSHQATKQIQGSAEADGPSRFYTMSAGLSSVLKRSGVQFDARGNSSFVFTDGTFSRTLGPSLAVRKGIGKKSGTVSATFSFLRASAGQAVWSNVVAVRFGLNFNVKRRHFFDSQVSRSDRFKDGYNVQKFSETNIQFGYSYRFGTH